MQASNPVITGLARGLTHGALAGAVAAVLIGVFIGYPCASTAWSYGIWLEECPDTEMRLQADVGARGLLRGEAGEVVVRPRALWLDGEGPSPRQVMHGLTRGVQVELTLLDVEDAPVDGLVVGAGEWEEDALTLPVTLPEVVDGPYRLRATITTAFDRAEVLIDLPLFVPALAHVTSDRPLYRPGQEVKLRSVLLARTDLRPLGGRPGTWRIRGPDGAEMHIEKGRADGAGIADTTVPLDNRAPIGSWTAIWESGDASDEIPFEVRPFRLPRLTLESAPSARWFKAGDRVAVEGVARYSSGAPVGNAPIEVTLARTEGRWPAPLAWEKPFSGQTAADGTFQIDLGHVPGDLIERAVFEARLRVTEEAGEVAEGRTQLVFSQDDLRIEAVTELADGLIGGFNNRAWIRVMTPDGRALPGAEVEVHNPWDPSWPVRRGEADEDAVVAVQLDPGPPVTVVHPAAPARPRPFLPPPPSLVRATEGVEGRALNMAERRAIDGVMPAVARCGDFTVGDGLVQLGLAVEPGGGVRHAFAQTEGLLSACVTQAFQRLRMPLGGARTYSLNVRVPDSLRPDIRVNGRAVIGELVPVDRALSDAALRARRCMNRGEGEDGAHVFDVHWSASAGQAALSSRVQPRARAGLRPGAIQCIRQELASIRLKEPLEEDLMGSAALRLRVPAAPGSVPSRPTTTTGYELKVAASSAGEALGETRLILPVGQIPPLRMRATPSLAHPGQEVQVELLRGPGYQGSFPEKLALMDGSRRVAEAEMTGNTARFVVPQDASGFLRVEHDGGQAVILVQPTDPLRLTLSTDQTTYRPGETARLSVQTQRGDRPAPASVGLSGVDQTLGQLAPLLQPDDWGRVTVRAEADQPAFGFDPKVLALGGVSGANAAQAAVLRISRLPQDAGGDQSVSGDGVVRLNWGGIRADAFYRVMERLIPRVRKWEQTAPSSAQMQPSVMVTLWGETLDALRAEGEPATDAFGRELTLERLPTELLSQVDPRNMVVDGTRLPEDMIDWNLYITEEVR